MEIELRIASSFETLVVYNNVSMYNFAIKLFFSYGCECYMMDVGAYDKSEGPTPLQLSLCCVHVHCMHIIICIRTFQG
jgi:hypothetical protein